MKTPFKLLEAYLEGDRHKFFGRNDEIQDQYDAVQQSQLILIYGLSGTGKTSLLRCGLYNEFEGPDWYPLFVRTGSNINDSVAQVLKKALKGDVTGDNVEDIIRLYDRTYRPPYLIVDQFEEFFTLIGNTREVEEKFMEDLRRLLDAGIECRIVLVMREEFLAQLSPFEKIVPELFDFRFRVERMHADKVRQVIQESFAKFNIAIEDPASDNLDLMVRNIGSSGVIDLPYLQVYLDMLYHEAVKEAGVEIESDQGPWPEVTITRDMIDDLGKVEQVLTRFLNERVDIYTKYYRLKKIEGVPPDFVRKILGLMVTDRGTKLPVPFKTEPGADGKEIMVPDFENKIIIETAPREEVSGLIEKLIGQQIITRKVDTIELAHDSLAAIIADWTTDEERHLRVLYERIETWYDQYAEESGSEELLLSNAQLASIKADEHLLSLDQKYLDFIEKSKKARDARKREEKERHERERQQRDEAIAARKEAQEQRDQAISAQKKANRLRGAWIGTLAVLAVAIGVTFWLSYEKWEADKEAAELTLLLEADRTNSLIADSLNKANQIERLKEIVTIDTTANEDIVIDTVASLPTNYIVENSFVTAEYIDGDFNVIGRSDRFVVGDDVWFMARVVVDVERQVYGHIETLNGERVEGLSVGTDVRVVPNPNGYRIKHAVHFKNPGAYKAVLSIRDNGQTVILGSHAFSISSTKPKED